MKIASRESNVDSFGLVVSSFFNLNEDQKAAISKHKLPRLVPETKTPIFEAVSGKSKYEGQLNGAQKSRVGHHRRRRLHRLHLQRRPRTRRRCHLLQEWRLLQRRLANDLPDGQGLLLSKDGRRYEGGFKGGLKEGFGVFHWLDGSKYEGQWGKVQHGQGKYTDAKGRETEGEFYQGKN